MPTRHHLPRRRTGAAPRKLWRALRARARHTASPATARRPPGDRLLLFLASNEAFIDAFWAAILAGSCRCRWRRYQRRASPQLLRIAGQLGDPSCTRTIACANGCAISPSSRVCNPPTRSSRGAPSSLMTCSTLGARAGSMRCGPGTWPSSSIPPARPATPRRGVTHANLLANLRGRAPEPASTTRTPACRGCRSRTTWVDRLSHLPDRQLRHGAPDGDRTVRAPPCCGCSCGTHRRHAAVLAQFRLPHYLKCWETGR